MLWLTAIPIAIAYNALAEYVLHRWVMHFPGLGKNEWWKAHSIEHHGHKRDDVNITTSALIGVVFGWPLFIFAYWLGWAWIAFVLIECILYASVWSSLHASFHEVGSHWLTKWRHWPRWHQHHMAHHDHPSRNFGAVFILTDRLFKTKTT